VLVTPQLGKRLLDADIDYEIRAMDRPSDHCPVWATFDL
jgi:exodeoxyribonuclease-3